MKCIVILGANGQLGAHFSRELGSSGLNLDLPKFDISERDRVLDELPALRPAAIINCAGFTNVDKAENQAEICQAINGTAVGYLAEAARLADCPLVQISTDYVFGGDSARSTPYTESDAPAPLGVYAASKLAGEQHAAVWHKSCIVRTCGLYSTSPRADNFVNTMLRVGAERGQVRVIDDQYCTPTYVPHLVRAVLFLLDERAYGNYHVVNSGFTTWYRFALEIFQQAGMPVTVMPITSAEWPSRARRPAYSVLDTSKYRALGGPVMPSWREALAEYFQVRRSALTPADAAS